MDPIKQRVDAAYQQLTGPGAPFELVETELGGRRYKAFRNAPRTLRELFAPARQYGAKEFLVYEGERWSFDRLLGLADAIGHQLVHRHGIRPGDRVAIAMRNYPEWMAAYIAIGSIGAVIVPLNSWGRTAELEYALRDAGARLLFCDQQRLDYIADLLPALGVDAVVARPEAEAFPPRACSLAAFVAGAEAAAMPEVEIDTDDLAIIAYTSGTTGAPKGAASTHRSVCQAITCFECSGMALAMSNGEIIAKVMAMGFEPCMLLAVPLFHVSGCYAVFLTALRAGRKIVMMYKWDVERALRYIEDERVTMLSAAPSMLMELLESPRWDAHDTKSLCGVGAGGAATPPKIGQLMVSRVEHPLGGTGWGMTETNALGTSFNGAAFMHRMSSSGFRQPIVELSFRDDDGNEVPPGTAGQIWVYGITLIKEYWNRPDANAKDFRDGWFNSGDIGYFDADGYLYISDRAKDMVIRGGENIYPLEIEAALMDCTDVVEAVAFGVPDERWGEEVGMVVRVRDDCALDADGVRAFLAQRLAGFKVPRYIELTHEPLPRNATHKILKKEVRAAFLARHASP